MGDIAAEKQALRRKFRQIAAGLSAEYVSGASEKIIQTVLRSAVYAAARTVFIYVSMPGEPATAPLIVQALRDGKRVCVPRCREKPRMGAVTLRDLKELIPGAYGIPEPLGGEVVSPQEIGLALIPCVAASRDSMRLGHGGGYYDTFLQGADMRKWCLCFERLLQKTLPAASWDAPMDAVVTEKTIYFHKKEEWPHETG